MLKKVVPSFTLVNFNIGQVVYHQGQEPTLVYVVVSGDFPVVKRVKKKQDKQLNDQDAKSLLNTAT